MARFNTLWGAGLTAGAVGVLAAIVLMAPTGPATGVDRERTEASTAHHDVLRVGRSGPVGGEGNPAVRATGQSLESRARRSETADPHIGDYVDPDGAVLPSVTTEDSVVEEAYQDPEHDLPLPDPREAVSDVGEYVDPGEAP